ncbi:MAG: hypothetical protein Q9M97_07485 [Candidatus Gracilibacteria bacterium]|nr:hypothetical protein [Candidatus Gracilibacteria bacterium]
MLFEKIIEEKDILKYLMKRDLLSQYKKSKIYLLLGLFAKVNFGLREPKKDEIYYFRINRQFRGILYY